MEKEKRIKKEIKVFARLFKDVEKDKQEIVKKLYEQAAFMKVTLEDLQDAINEKGAVIEGKNGNGFIVLSENPAQKSYNTMIKNYTSVMKLLSEYTPKTEGDALMEFLND